MVLLMIGKKILPWQMSFEDIAMVRNPEVWSGTGENIFKKIYV